MSYGVEYCGLELLVDVELPELRIIDRLHSPDLTISEAPHSSDIGDILAHQWSKGPANQLSMARVDSRYLLQFEDGTVFEFDVETGNVRCPTTLDATGRHQLLDQVLPRVLDQLGHLMIHGSAIVMQGGAVMFIGDSGQGKSTLAASFHDAGIEVLSDDCLRLTIDFNAVGCVPTYRSLRLWSDSADEIMAGAASVPMAEDTDKRRITLPAPPPVRATPVAAICVLATPSGISSAVTFAKVPPARAVSLLLAQCFRLDPTDQTATARAFEHCVDVIERVPIVELRYPRDYGRLPEVRDAVLQQVANDGWAEVTAR